MRLHAHGQAADHTIQTPPWPACSLPCPALSCPAPLPDAISCATHSSLRPAVAHGVQLKPSKCLRYSPAGRLVAVPVDGEVVLVRLRLLPASHVHPHALLERRPALAAASAEQQAEQQALPAAAAAELQEEAAAMAEEVTDALAEEEQQQQQQQGAQQQAAEAAEAAFRLNLAAGVCCPASARLGQDLRLGYTVDQLGPAASLVFKGLRGNSSRL